MKMKINEVEKITEVKSANIRYYEKAGLLNPNRDKSNGYRHYSEEDVDRIEKIKMLRMLDVSLEDIKKLFDGNVTMSQVMEKRLEALEKEEAALKESKKVCEDILNNHISLSELNQDVFQEDKVIWKERLEQLWTEDVDKVFLVRGCIAMLAMIGATVAYRVPFVDFFNGSVKGINDLFVTTNPFTIWILPKLAIFFFVYALVLALFEGIKNKPLFYMGVGVSHWRTPGLGILTNSFTFCGLGIGILMTSVQEGLIYYVIGCIACCGIRACFMHYHGQKKRSA